MLLITYGENGDAAIYVGGTQRCCWTVNAFSPPLLPLCAWAWARVHLVKKRFKKKNDISERHLNHAEQKLRSVFVWGGSGGRGQKLPKKLPKQAPNKSQTSPQNARKS